VQKIVLRYSDVGVMAMSTEYRMQPCENGFLVIDPWGEQLVNTYSTEDAARQDIERCKKEEAMWETAKLLVDTAIKAHMQIHDVGRETASYWINSALGGT
jgi:hypothetical protein